VSDIDSAELKLANAVAALTAARIFKGVEEKLREFEERIIEKIGRRVDELTKRILELDKSPKIVGISERQPRVLIVDDHRGLADALVRTLEDYGMSASPSITVDDALNFLEQDVAIEVAVVDVKMPKNGHTLLEHIRENHPRVAVIMTSGRIEIDPEQALKIGAFGFLQKPLDIASAVLMITRAAEYHRALLAAGMRG